jgi:hypothetical protein
MESKISTIIEAVVGSVICGIICGAFVEALTLFVCYGITYTYQGDFVMPSALYRFTEFITVAFFWLGVIGFLTDGM